MIGAGPMEEEIRTKAVALGLPDELLLAGRRPPSEVADYMRVARCLVLSSHNEGVPNVILEAFASGLPVISTDVGGISEVLNADFLGELVPPGDAEALADALVRAVSAEVDRSSIAARGSAFGWAETAKKYWNLLQSQAS